MTGLIYYGMFCLGIFVIGMFAMLGDWLVDGEWGFAAALVGMLIGFGIVFQLFRLVRRKRRTLNKTHSVIVGCDWSPFHVRVYYMRPPFFFGLAPARALVFCCLSPSHAIRRARC